MNILFFAIGTEVLASSRTRVYRFIPYLQAKGVGCRVVSYLSESRCRHDISMKRLNPFTRIREGIISSFRILKLLFLIPSYDVVFIQKVLLPVFVQKIIRLYNKTIIFDFDDALQITTGMVFSRFANILQNSDLVLVENDFNRVFVSRYNQNIGIITGPIDVEKYKPRTTKSSSDKVTIGWIGSSSTNRHLEMLRNVLRALKSKYGEKIVIKTISSEKLNLDNTPYVHIKWQLNTEAEELQTFDIGIAPLDNDMIAKGKGGYKLLQYMAIGIPCVASPIGINCQLIKEGINGFLAKTEDEWIARLSALIEDPQLRLKMGTSGRRLVEEDYSYEKSIPKLISLINQVHS